MSDAAESIDTTEQLKKRLRVTKEALRQLEKENALIEAALQQLREERALNAELYKGTYYSTFSQVWSTESVSYTGNHDYMADMTRNTVPWWNTNVNNEIGSPYQLTLDKARDPNTKPKDDAGSARGSHSSSSVNDGCKRRVLGFRHIRQPQST